MTFEIEDNDESETLVIGHSSPSKAIGTRVCYYFLFLLLVVSTVGIVVSSGEEPLKEEDFKDVEQRKPSKEDTSLLGDALLTTLKEEHNVTLEEKISMFSPADPSDRSMISLYSPRARDTLKELLRTKRNDTFTLLASGGSTTAAAGHILTEELFFVRFARHLESSYDVQSNVINMGHGARDSFHSFLMAESFFPPQVDLVVWEFSMNDRQERSHENAEVEERNLLIYWLTKIAKLYHPNPPPVMLVYYWSSPLLVSDNKIKSEVFDSHASLACEFDFVLGHVHMGGYLNSLGWEEDVYQTLFLAENDDHHPNPLGHGLTATLMQQLLEDESLKHEECKGKTDLVWACNSQTKDHELLKDILFKEKLVSKASYIADVPRNDPNVSRGVLEPTFLLNQDKTDAVVWSQVDYGKSTDWRTDRQHGLQLPNCDAEGKLVLETLSPIRAVHFLVMNGGKGYETNNTAILANRQLGLFAQGGMAIGVAWLKDLRVWLGDENYSDRIIDAIDWGCMLSQPMYRRWLVPEDVNVSRIELCDAGDSKQKTALALEHLAIF